MTSGLTSFRQLQKFPKDTVPSLEEHEIQPSNSRKAPCTTKPLGMRADYLPLTLEECQLSTSTSRGGFSQLSVCEWDPEFASEWGMVNEMY